MKKNISQTTIFEMSYFISYILVHRCTGMDWPIGIPEHSWWAPKTMNNNIKEKKFFKNLINSSCCEDGEP